MYDPPQLEWVQRPGPELAAEIRQLLSAVTEEDGVAPLSEQALLSLTAPGLTGHHLLARRDGELIGYLHLDDQDAEATAELAVAPSARRAGVGSKLFDELLSRVGARAVHVWSHGGLTGASHLALRYGFASTRELWQMRRSLAEPLPEPAYPSGVSVRTFVVGQDESAWLDVNRQAFDWHPEQGRWTVDDLRQREEEPWFDPAGFFLAERDAELLGFHWTKVHAGAQPLGEVYVVGVRPSAAGRGLGRALTLTGLQHLQQRGLSTVLLYVEADNEPAVRTYTRLGFTRWSVDVLYTREPPSS